MPTEPGSRHRPTTDGAALPIRPGLVVEDRGCADPARRFRFTIPASGAAFLTPEEAGDLGRWLIGQASARTA